MGGKTEKHPEFAIRIDGNAQEEAKARSIFDSLCMSDRYDDKKRVCDVVNNIASDLSSSGRAVYEIIRSGQDEGAYYLYGFTSKRLLRLAGYYIQIIPKHDFGLWKKRMIIQGVQSVWDISMPSDFGGSSGYEKILHRFRKHGDTGPEFWRQDLERQEQSKFFDFSEHVLKQEINTFRVTKRWGWNKRDFTLKNRTEFYLIYRHITLQWAKAIIREHIISELNQLLSRLSIKSTVLVNGLPTAQEILKLREKMIKGKISFSEATDFASV